MDLKRNTVRQLPVTRAVSHLVPLLALEVSVQVCAACRVLSAETGSALGSLELL